LGEEEAAGSALDIDAEEEAQFSHVLDGELGAQMIDDVLQQTGA
jgi:hypothetical protein